MAQEGDDRARWLIARGALLLLSFGGAFLGDLPVHHDFEHPAPVSFLAIIIGFTLFGLIYVVSISSVFKTADAKWLRPSLFIRPFGSRQPLVSFDTGAICMLAYAVGGAVRGLSESPHNWFWEIPVTAAIGLWIGVRLIMVLESARVE